MSEKNLSFVRLAQLVRLVDASRSRDESRPALCGIQVLLSPGCVQLLGTDGFILTLVEADVTGEESGTILVDGEQLLAFTKAHRTDRHYCRLTIEEAVLAIRPLDSDGFHGSPLALFPALAAKALKWQAILSDCGGRKHTTVDTEPWLKLLAGYKGNGFPVTMGLDVTGGPRLVLPAQSGQIGLNPALLARVLRPYKGLSPHFELGWRDPTHPITLTYEDTNWRAVHVVMPMRLGF